MASPIIVWFRRDLRLQDNTAWTEAVQSRRPVLPVYIHAPEEEGESAPGGASKWWLHFALEDLAAQLDRIGTPLTIRTGRATTALDELVRSSGAGAVYWNHCYTPSLDRRDVRVARDLRKSGVETKGFNSSLLFDPGEIRTASGDAYRVFGPFARAVAGRGQTKPVAEPPIREIAGVVAIPSATLADLALLSGDGDKPSLAEHWHPTRRAGLQRLDDFLEKGLSDYHRSRDFPARPGTSRLSPYLHFGQIGVRELIHRVLQERAGGGSEVFKKEVLWREFAYHVLHHFPHTCNEPFKPAFAEFPWRKSFALQAWREGRTGYPMVDAGMREILQTGWIHNRSRMMVASFLTKHLLVPWQEGARWFRDQLVDADVANNTMGWQWVAGCGVDAAPFFRIFNPVTQGEKFDPDGAYVRRFVPELSRLPARFIHRPWTASPATLQAADVELGKNYPHPIVDHRVARDQALHAFESISRRR